MSSTPSSSSAKQKTLPAYFHFLNGGLAGMAATCIVQPMDVVKTRMQLSGEGGAAVQHKNFVHALSNIGKHEGLAGLYKGLSAGLLRQATYTTSRLGMFNIMMDYVGQGNLAAVPFYQKLAIASTAGGLAALIGTPAEIALIRMAADGRMPVEQRRNYRNAFDAIARMAREEGVATLWRGATPTVVRAIVLNMAQLATFAEFKAQLMQRGFGDTLFTHFWAAMGSGFICTAVSLPVDLLKTRLQTMKAGAYSGVMDVLMTTVRKEGVLSLWKGFWPYYLRLGPHTVFTFIFSEKLRLLAYKLVY